MATWEYMVVSKVTERKADHSRPKNAWWGSWTYAALQMPDGSTRRIELWNKYEKEEETTHHTTLPEVLTELGREGWEVVGTVPIETRLWQHWSEVQSVDLYLKRPVPTST